LKSSSATGEHTTILQQNFDNFAAAV